MKEKIAVFWSGGKDAALALYTLQQSDEYEPVLLVCTINQELKRVAMHGISEILVDEQAKSIGLPLLKMYLPSNPDNATYETKFLECLDNIQALGVQYVAFGDIFLADLRVYRENLVKKSNMTVVFPIWSTNSNKIVKKSMDLGFRSITCCVDNNLLSDEFLGVEINPDFIQKLPAGVDTCGENGEFHTFCFAGPVFQHEIQIQSSTIIKKQLAVNAQFSYIELNLA